MRSQATMQELEDASDLLLESCELWISNRLLYAGTNTLLVLKPKAIGAPLSTFASEDARRTHTNVHGQTKGEPRGNDPSDDFNDEDSEEEFKRQEAEDNLGLI
jgi:hypothetical protein